MASTKKFKAKDGKKYTIYRMWAYGNSWFCDKGKIKKKNVKYIPIHNTGNHGIDKATSNANYFRNNKTRYAGAQFIIGFDGTIVQCGRLKDACYAVGGDKYPHSDGGKYYKKCTNYNSISIELCGIVDNYPSKKQRQATRAVIEYIQKYCKNAKTIIRHWDVTGKDCPQRFSGKSNTAKGKAWSNFKSKIKPK